MTRSRLALAAFGGALVALLAAGACGPDNTGGGGGTPKGPFCDPPDAGLDASIVGGIGASEQVSGQC